MSYEILLGDCLGTLKTMPEKSVHCCVTSPPYFGLRDYGREGQLGMEPTPDEFVEALVRVFREVWRVLRDDGTVFLNLGDSYYVGRAQSRGTSGKAKQGSRGRGSSSRNRDGERIDAWWSRIPDTDARHALAQAVEPLSQIRARMGLLSDRLPSAGSENRTLTPQFLGATQDQARDAARAVERLLGVLPSMLPECAPQPLEGCRPSDTISACLSSLRTFAACVQRCVDKLDASIDSPDCTEGIVSLFEELSHHIRCTDGYCSLVSAWLNPPYVQPQRTTLKNKDLIGIPWRVAFALQQDGWYLRQDVIWAKPNPMPESVRDRCTKAHEYVFLLSKGQRYYYDHEAAKEPSVDPTRMRSDAIGHTQRKLAGRPVDRQARQSAKRNRRSVWTVTTRPYKGAHFATFPPALIEPCILAGCPEGGTVLDPFGGSGTTAGVALAHGRRAILCELNPEYADLVPERVEWVMDYYGFDPDAERQMDMLEAAQ